ncbi:MAG: AgmX/PglI C-terminal domain-containing protein [Kofleriaceae bacterium]
MSGPSYPHPSESTRAVEVAALLGDSVIGVKHCIDPTSGTLTRMTWGVLAASAMCLVTSATAFALSINTAASNTAALERWQAANKPAYAFRPAQAPAATDWLAFGGLGLGLIGAAAGVARVRREHRSPYYRIGSAPGVEQPLEHAPAPAFPLVAPSRDRFVLNFAQGLDGELTTGGQALPLAQLVASGRATPSSAIAGAFELPIAENDRIRVRAGKTTFLIAGIAAPKPIATPAILLEGRALKYAAGSLAFHLALLLVLNNVYDEDAGIGIDLRKTEYIETTTTGTTTETPPPEPDDSTGDTGGEGSEQPTLALAEGAAGNPNAAKADGKLEIEKSDKPPAMRRAEAVEAAAIAGILGSSLALNSAISNIASTADYASGFSDLSVYGPLDGTQGEGRGTFGGGVRGIGPGGGCSTPPCGIIISGRYETTGDGPGTGPGGWGSCVGPHCKGGLRNRVASVPGPKTGTPRIIGEYDKSIVRRYIQRNAPKLAYCYEHQLLASPGIAGEILANFFIAPNGTVQSSNAAGFDSTVASCVADVIKNIEFPKPGEGGVEVKYPFTFRAAAG